MSALICLLAVLGAIGCTAITHSLHSNVFEKPDQPMRSLVLVYAHADLVEKSRTNDATASDPLAKVGYYDIPNLLAERAKPVFAANGIQVSQVITIPAQRLSDFLKERTTDKTREPILTIQMIGGSTHTYGSKNIYLRQQANLYSSSPLRRVWTGLFQNVVGYSSVMTLGYDRTNVDLMLVTVLQQMAKDGMISEPDRGIRRPDV